MDLSADELAGVVDLFGVLSRSELRRACSELAFKRGDDLPTETVDAAIGDAVDTYALVPLSEGTEESLVVGPAAFPALPDGAADLPHIMDVQRRTPDPERVGSVARRRYETDAETALANGDGERIEELLEVGYEFDVWGLADVDVEEVRARLADAESGRAN